MTLLIKHAKIVNGTNAGGESAGLKDILIENGKIMRIGQGLAHDDAQVIDAAGKIVMPGFIDLHVHLREPGREDKETIESGRRAAAR